MPGDRNQRLACAILLAASAAARAAVSTDGLIVHLDAAEQARWLASGRDRAAWQNLASPGEAGAARLHHFAFDATSGWTGGGGPGDPCCLRFDGRNTYVEGTAGIDRPEVTLEAWACVEGVANSERKGNNARAATLVGNDFGTGGISLMVHASGKPLILHDKTFSPAPAETPLWQWQQVAAVYRAGTVRVYVNGSLACTMPAPRQGRGPEAGAYQLGAARAPASDDVEADGLVGRLAIVRVYGRALSGRELAANYDADRGRFGLPPAAEASPVSSMPVPTVPGLGPVPPVRGMKWDYCQHPPQVSGSGAAGWPSNARQAFDGYPSDVGQPYLRNYWICEAGPGKPAEVTINYRRPVAVTRFVHYYIEPAAWREAEIQASDDGEVFQTVQACHELPAECPQVLSIDRPRAAMFYRILVRRLADGVSQVMAHEIETYYGATIGGVVAESVPIQGEPVAIRVAAVNPDADMSRLRLKVVAPADALATNVEADLPAAKRGEPATAPLEVVPRISGPIPMSIELLVDGMKIDERPFTLRVRPGLAFGGLNADGVVLARTGEQVEIRGTITNAGRRPAKAVGISWLRQTVPVGDLDPAASASFSIKAVAPPGLSTGELVAQDASGTRSVIRRPVICATSLDSARVNANAALLCRLDKQGLSLRLSGPDNARLDGWLRLLVGDREVPFIPVGDMGTAPSLVAPVPGGVLALMIVPADETRDIELKFGLLACEPNPVTVPCSDFELRLAFENPKILFRPHIDWYTVEHGPNFPDLVNAHHSATRMLCVQAAKGTACLVPSTDNLVWGFTRENEMACRFHIPLRPDDLLGRRVFRPIGEGPMQFGLLLPVLKGDWWDAYRYVVTRVFRFEQPRQWAMPVTQMQMLAARYSMRAEVWSERWQTVRSHPGIDFFYNFYGLTYNIPSLYSWYLATDDSTARAKAEKEVEFLLGLQERAGPAAGAWFSMYCVEGSPPKLVGRDQAFNRWIMPHATGTSAWTLEWYWEAGGKKDGRALAAARRGCDWLVATQLPDGSWPYGLDLDGKAVSSLSGAGQIWCTWALWKMHRFTGDDRYREAALRSRDAFKRTYMDVHRYMGYWEDVSGAGGKIARSWEGYEPGVAALVFADMGEKELAVAAARDAATWTWTRVTSTRQYETSYGQTTEQSLCGPSQAQSPMIGVGLQQVYQLTGDRFWNDLAGGIKAVNFCADPDQAYGMVATGGWDDPTTGVIGPPYENTRPVVSPNNSRGDEYGRQVWNNWCTDQFAWLALEWLVREANLRAPRHLAIDTISLRGTVLGEAGRIRMPEERCDVQPVEHIDVNWVGAGNDRQYLLVLMNHQEDVTVLVRPHEAHLGVYSRQPRILVAPPGGDYRPCPVSRRGVQYEIRLPARGTALLVWDRIR
jgi:hypothetical protein